MTLDKEHARAASAGLNYFTCTLAEAANIKTRQPVEYTTINEFIDVQAQRFPERPAVAFAVPNDAGKPWGCEIFSFRDLFVGSVTVADELHESLKSIERCMEAPCVALLCPNSINFLFSWLALMRAGLSVLLIAPQCPAAAIAHLCGTCGAASLFYDELYAIQAKEAVHLSSSRLNAHVLPWQTLQRDIVDLIRSDRCPKVMCHPPFSTPKSHTIAYIHHTSGTSSGLPKPIPQTHHAGIGVLPCLDGAESATFTTTPLFHGGIADCFRAWKSGALIWLFPGADIPVTAKNVMSCISATTGEASKVPDFPQVRYFSSVPYILQMLVEDKTSLIMLRGMALVGVGGAALPTDVGDLLVRKGVNLVSRFGSAECGFLLSSHRDYPEDKDWQYLRVPQYTSWLQFERQKDGSRLFELVVLKGWPHMAKSNRVDGSFATSDLFQPHKRIAGAWKYHSRSDSQITLVTGKKFDPAPLEDIICSKSSLITEVLVFGNGKQVPGALIFVQPFSHNMDDKEIMAQVWPAVSEANRNGQGHTRLPRDMLAIVRDKHLEKSSKGTILRSVAEKTFATEIEKAYESDEFCNCENFFENKDTREIVREIVASFVEAKEFGDQDDFYQNGIDSGKCTAIRGLLQKTLAIDKNDLPWNIVYDCGNIDSLSNFFTSRSGGELAIQGGRGILDIVEQFSVFENPSHSLVGPSTSDADYPSGETLGHVVVLTGATGALGAHILDILRSEITVLKIICLVRASSDKVAQERVSSALLQRNKRPIDTDDMVTCYASSLGAANLGLSEAFFKEIRRSVTLIIHAAWAVNFALPLRSFVKDHLTGLHSLLNLAFLSSCNADLLFCSSTASVLGPSHPRLIPEKLSSTPEDVDVLGYSRSKWVAEAMCARASQVLSKLGSSAHGGRVKILRIGQLTGDTKEGIWNMLEAYPLMLSTVTELGCLPRIDDYLSWLPLDIAARAVVEIALTENTDNATYPDIVYHITNNAKPATWAQLLEWIKDINSTPFQIVEPRYWLQRLEDLEEHPAKRLIGFWKAAYGQSQNMSQDVNNTPVSFSTERAQNIAPALKDMAPIDKKLVEKIWHWMQEESRRQL